MSVSLERRLDSFEAALSRLVAALREPESEWTRDAAIQRFEFTFELAWKSTGQAVAEEGIDCASPRAALRAAARLGWIEDDDVWLQMLDDRNMSSHVYDEEAARLIYRALPGYADAFSTLLANLRRCGTAADP